MNYKELIRSLIKEHSLNVSDSRQKEVCASLENTPQLSTLGQQDIVNQVLAMLRKKPTTAFSYIKASNCPSCNTPMHPCILHNDRKAFLCKNCRITQPAQVQ